MKVPNDVADNKSPIFPAGTYVGELGDIEDRWVGEGQNGLFVRTLLTNISPADDSSPEVGARTMREDICFMLEGDSLFDYEEIDGETPFLFRRGAGLLASLATATGAAARSDDGIDFDAQTFGEGLRNNDFTGEKVKFQVTHRNRKRKDTGTTVREAQISRFATLD